MNITTSGSFNGQDFSCNGRRMYSCKKILESGAGGTVWRGLDDNHQVCALKVLKILRLNKLSSRALKCATLVNYDDCPHRDHGVQWCRLQDGQLAAVTTRGSQRIALDLKTCVELFGVDLDNSRVPDNYRSWLKQRRIKLEEARLQRKYDNDNNVVKVLDILEDFGVCYRNQHQIIFVQEYCVGGDLIQHLENFSHLTAGDGLNMEDLRVLSQQLISVLSRLHKSGVAHSDIKIDNILCADRSSQPIVKLTDFGLACEFDNKQEPLLTRRVGTFGYWAPELFADGRDSIQPYNAYHAEAWSLGVTLYTLYAGHPPFGAHPWNCVRLAKYCENQERGKKSSWLIPKNWDADFRDLIYGLLTVDVNSRYQVVDLYDHEFVRLETEVVDPMMVSMESMASLEDSLNSTSTSLMEISETESVTSPTSTESVLKDIEANETFYSSSVVGLPSTDRPPTTRPQAQAFVGCIRIHWARRPLSRCMLSRATTAECAILSG